MSAIVCGKRSLFEDLAAASPPVSKKIRYSSPSRFSPPNSPPSSVLLNDLASSFPDIDKQILEQAFHECGDDLDSTITCLTQLRLESANKNADSTANQSPAIQESNFEAAQQASTKEEASSNTGAEAMQILEREFMLLRQQMESVVQENSKLKRVIVTQHKQRTEFEDLSREQLRTQEENMLLRQEVQQMKQQMRTQEMKIYDLTIQLKHAEQYRSIQGRYNPDVF